MSFDADQQREVKEIAREVASELIAVIDARIRLHVAECPAGKELAAWRERGRGVAWVCRVVYGLLAAGAGLLGGWLFGRQP